MLTAGVEQGKHYVRNTLLCRVRPGVATAPLGPPARPEEAVRVPPAAGSRPGASLRVPAPAGRGGTLPHPHRNGQKVREGERNKKILFFIGFSCVYRVCLS